MTSWLDRYQQGAGRQVWAEITGLGATVRQNPETAAAAEQVGRETMRRARHNIELLVAELPRIGYEFEPGPGLTTFELPQPDTRDHLDQIEKRVGYLPLSWRWWCEEVGRVNFMGSHPDWTFDSSDPLVVDAPANYVNGEISAWLQNRGTAYDSGQPFSIDFSPDHLHKANISGGPPYSLTVPNEAADGLVLWEVHHTTFVNYLRIAFVNGGFMGWSGGHCKDLPPPELSKLAAMLQPL